MKRKQHAPSIDRIPPHSLDAEVAVIGAAMLSVDACDEARALLSPESFYRDAHRTIWKAVDGLRRRREPVDVVMLKDELECMDKLDDVGGALYLSECLMRTTTAANVGFHARIVFEKFLLRRTIEVAMRATAAAFEPESDALQVVERAQRAFGEIAEQRAHTSIKLIGDVVDEITQYLDRVLANNGKIVGIPTGLTLLDKLIGGLQETNLYLLAARPGMGKTAILLSWLRHIAQTGKHAGLLSLEMSRLAIAGRIISSTARVNTANYFTGQMDQWEVAAIRGQLDDLQRLPIHIDDTPGISRDQIEVAVNTMIREYDCEVIGLDYAQLASADEETRAREITTIAYTCKNLARIHKKPIILLSQLNREVDKRGDKRPMLSDLKESAGLEEAADVVMFVHRPEYYGVRFDDKGDPVAGIAEIIVRKNRNGALDIVKCAFVEKYASFEDLDLKHAADAAPSFHESDRDPVF